MVESKTGTTGVVTGGGQGSFMQSKTVAAAARTAPKPEPKAEAKPSEPKEAPWNPPFPPPGDGNYEVKWSDQEVVKAIRRDGTWKLADDQSIHMNIHAWRSR